MRTMKILLAALGGGLAVNAAWSAIVVYFRYSDGHGYIDGLLAGAGISSALLSLASLIAAVTI
jgi:hypothetical protein